MNTLTECKLGVFLLSAWWIVNLHLFQICKMLVTTNAQQKENKTIKRFKKVTIKLTKLCCDMLHPCSVWIVSCIRTKLPAYCLHCWSLKRVQVQLFYPPPALQSYGPRFMAILTNWSYRNAIHHYSNDQGLPCMQGESTSSQNALKERMSWAWPAVFEVRFNEQICQVPLATWACNQNMSLFGS